MTLEDVREFLEEYRYLHRNDGDGGIGLLLELVAVRDRMDAETRAVFDQLLVALIRSDPEPQNRMDAVDLLAMARWQGKHKPSENVFAEVADWLRSGPPHVEVSERVNMIRRILCSRTDQAIDLYEELLNWDMLNDPAQALQTMSYLYVITRSEGYKARLAQGLCTYASSEGANMQYVLNNLLLVGEYGGLDFVDEVIKEVEVTCPTTSYFLVDALIRGAERYLGMGWSQSMRELLREILSLLRSYHSRRS